HGVEVADRAPGAAQARAQLVQRQHQAVPARVGLVLGEQLGDGGAAVGQDLVNGGFDVFRQNQRVGRQVEVLQQGVVRGHNEAPVKNGDWVVTLDRRKQSRRD